MLDGLINHDDLIRQPLDYNGMLNFPKAPTDIDGLIEVDNRGYIIIEVKRGHTKMPQGQQIALERMVQDFRRSGKHAVAILLRHELYDPTQVIYPAFLPVVGIYDGKEWRGPKQPCLAHEFVKQTMKLWNGKNTY